MNDLDFNSEEEDLNRGNLNHFAGDLQSFNRTVSTTVTWRTSQRSMRIMGSKVKVMS